MPTKNETKKIIYALIKEKVELLDRLKEVTITNIESLQNKYFAAIYSKIENMVIFDGEKISLQTNVTALNKAIDEQIKRLISDSTDAANKIAQITNDIILSNLNWYEAISGRKKAELKKITEKAVSDLNEALGIKRVIDGKAELIPNGWLDKIKQGTAIKEGVGAAMVAGVTGQVSRQQLRLIVERQTKDRRLGHTIADTVLISNRSVSEAIAQNIGLTEYYLYVGGKVEDSRAFCVGGSEYKGKKVVRTFTSKIGKAFTRQEIEKWRGQTWQGKTNEAIYNPFVHCGGYNCLHQLLAISKEVYELYK